MAALSSAGRWPLTGRDGELAVLARVWGSRRVRGVVVAGPAGVGKTRLAEEFLAGSAREGVRSARATASLAAGTVPLGAIAHVIPSGVDLSDPVAGFAQVARVLAGPDRSRHWALLVDDLHLLDATSAVLLRQLTETGVVRLIATMRTGEPVGEATGALLAGGGVHQLNLEAFTTEQVGTVMEAALGGPVTRRTVHELASASRGNALYLRELVAGALSDGSLAWDGEIWQLAEDRSTASTPKLMELIEGRLGGVAASGRRVLELLAVCDAVPLADAQAAARDPAVVSGLEEVGLVRVMADRNRRTVQLAHPLYGEVVRAHLPVLRRRALLLEQTDRVRGHGGRRREDTVHAAAWQLAATGTADPALLARAAAVARFAHDYAQARTLLEALPDTEHTTATGLMLGEVLFELGDPQRAEQVLAAADRHAEAEPEALAVTIKRSLNLFWASGRMQEALDVNAAARERVSSDAGLRMLRYNEAAMRIAWGGDPQRGLALVEDLGDDIREAPDPSAWLIAANLKPFALEMAGRIDEARMFADHAYAAHTALLADDNRLLYPHPAAQLLAVVWVQAGYGNLGEARAVGERAVAELTEAKILVPRTWMAQYLGRVEWLAGHPAAARRWYAESIALARTRGSVTPQGPAFAGVAACAALLGDLDGADRALGEARALPHMNLLSYNDALAWAWESAARGDLGGARAVLAAGAARARAAGMVTDEALLLTDIARLGGAREVAGRLAELARACDGTLAQARARLAAALAADSPDLLIEAAAELEGIGADLMAAEAAGVASAAYGRTGRTHKAAAAAQRAQACAARCEGARTPLLAATAQLTARERDVALLASHGTSSKDIADLLHLSPRTVENHLQHAYAKLGVTTRSELADALGHGTPSARRSPDTSR